MKFVNSKRSNSRLHFNINSNLLKCKRSQAGIIVIALIILIVIVLVLIIWNVIVPLIRERSEEVELGRFTTDLSIEEVALFENGVIHVDVKRAAGGGEIDSLMFIFYDENGDSKSLEEESINELETKTYPFSLIQGLVKIEKVAVVPVIDGNLGIEDEAETSEVLKVPSGVVKWWKFDEVHGFVEYYSNEDLIFEDEMAISFWVENNGNIKTNNYEIIVDEIVSFSWDGEVFESVNEVGQGWNHVVVSVAPAFSKIYINNIPETFLANLNVDNKDLDISEGVDNVILFNKALAESDVNGLYVYQKR